MKKLFFILTLVAGFSATASTTRYNTPEILVHQEKQYKKIEISQVAKDALDKIKKSYGSYTIKEAYRADDGEYKLVLSKDGVDTTATFTAAGDMIKIF